MTEGALHPLPATHEPWPGWAGDLVSHAVFDADPREVAPFLLGKLLVSVKDGFTAGGRIVETEAYLGSDDPGSHAATRGITPRNATMYGPSGHAYVYFTYGNHHMLNLVSDRAGEAGGVLIRGIEPLLGLAVMTSRRGGRSGHELTNGPGKLAQALGIDLGDNGIPLNRDRIFVYDAPVVPPRDVAMSGRIGLSAGHDLEYRYYLRGNPYVSRGRTGPVPGRSARRG